MRQLAADLQQGRAHILEQQRPEFETYEYEITDAGNYKFQAALGHDDEVSAKLLEHWELSQGASDIRSFARSSRRRRRTGWSRRSPYTRMTPATSWPETKPGARR